MTYRFDIQHHTNGNYTATCGDMSATPSAGRTGVVSGVGELRDRIWQAITAWEQACSEVDVMLRAAEVDAAIDALVAGTPRPLSHEAVAAMEAG